VPIDLNKLPARSRDGVTMLEILDPEMQPNIRKV
jgi:hypothetical protein